MNTIVVAEPTRRTAIRVVAERLEAWSHLLRFRAYRDTRRSVLAGEDLFDLKADDLGRRGLMTPLAFNCYETALAAMPASALAWTIAFLWPQPIPLMPETVPGFVGTVLAEFPASAAALGKICTSLQIPLTALAVASFTAWASLKRRDMSPAKRRRARDAYLYYEGAHGLVGEMLLAIWVTLTVTTNPAVVGPFWEMLRSFTYWGVAVFGGWHFWGLIWSGVPTLLFSLNGYDAATIGRSTRYEDSKEDGPWWKYRLSILVFGPIVGLVVWGVLLVTVIGGGLLLALLRTSVRALVA